MSSDVTLLAVGDVAVKRDDPASISRGCRDALTAGNIVFGQLETTVSERGSRVPHAKLAMRAPPGMVEAVSKVKIDAMSFAGNHCLDWGYDAFDDTMDLFTKAGVKLCACPA